MSKKNSWMEGSIVIESMDKHTSEIRGMLKIINKDSISKSIKDCNLDVYVISRGVTPLLLHSYTIILNKEIGSGDTLEYSIDLDGILLSSLASEVIDLEIRLRGTEIKTLFSVNRTDYIDSIELVLSDLGYELSDYAVDVKNKLITKLFRQYYVYKYDELERDNEIKITYTPNYEHIRVCIYNMNKKLCCNLKYKDILDINKTKETIREIFTELKVNYSETHSNT